MATNLERIWGTVRSCRKTGVVCYSRAAGPRRELDGALIEEENGKEGRGDWEGQRSEEARAVETMEQQRDPAEMLPVGDHRYLSLPPFLPTFSTTHCCHRATKVARVNFPHEFAQLSKSSGRGRSQPRRFQPSSPASLDDLL